MSEASTISLISDWEEKSPTLDSMADFLYEHAQTDPVLAPLFANLAGDLRQHVRDFLAEVFERRVPESVGGGPTTSWHAHVLVRYVGRYFTLQQRRAWMDLVVETAAVFDLLYDRHLTLALVEYLEWGSRSRVRLPNTRVMVS